VATFTPPTTDGNLIADPAKVGSDPAHALFRHYGAWEAGKTVWKDAQGVWHESLSPYLGGATYTTHDGDETTTSGPDAGLATAQRVYLGGHVYEITSQEETELIAAGYGAYIEP
jgi:hypothetical protein